jgi:hypothetical protein
MPRTAGESPAPSIGEIMLKRDELSNPNSCLNKAMNDEPIFVLRANDPCAPDTIRAWADLAKDYHEDSKRKQARYDAVEMEKWLRRKPCLPLPKPAHSVLVGRDSVTIEFHESKSRAFNWQSMTKAEALTLANDIQRSVGQEKGK